MSFALSSVSSWIRVPEGGLRTRGSWARDSFKRPMSCSWQTNKLWNQCDQVGPGEWDQNDILLKRGKKLNPFLPRHRLDQWNLKWRMRRRKCQRLPSGVSLRAVVTNLVLFPLDVVARNISVVYIVSPMITSAATTSKKIIRRNF